MEILFNLLFVPLIILINTLLKKNNYLLNYSGLKHQTYTNQKSVPLSGGLIILFFLTINFNSYESFFLISLYLFFLIAILGDLNLISSASIRFFLQIIFVIFFVYLFNLNISDLRIEVFNIFLKNEIFNYFFVAFCILVYVNGSNFIDGNNTLSIGYYIIVLLSILHLENLGISLVFDKHFLNSFLFLLIILLIFNFFNKIYLGDNGIYLLSIFFAFTVLKIQSVDPYISPYFIAVIFWYPSFEILFSFIRKIKAKNSPMNADNNHLHQLIFFYLTNKLRKKKYINSLTGLSINCLNLLPIIISLKDIYNTKHQVSILITSTIIYLIFFTLFYKYKKTSTLKKIV